MASYNPILFFFCKVDHVFIITPSPCSHMVCFIKFLLSCLFFRDVGGLRKIWDFFHTAYEVASQQRIKAILISLIHMNIYFHEGDKLAINKSLLCIKKLRPPSIRNHKI